MPVAREGHTNIMIRRCVPGADGQSLTVFLRDATFDDDPASGSVAVCD